MKFSLFDSWPRALMIPDPLEPETMPVRMADACPDTDITPIRHMKDISNEKNVCCLGIIKTGYFNPRELVMTEKEACKMKNDFLTSVAVNTLQFAYDAVIAAASIGSYCALKKAGDRMSEKYSRSSLQEPLL